MARLCWCAVLLGVCACGGAKKEECDRTRTFLFAEVPWQGAPRQADFSPAAQAENWRWRSEKAGKRATAALALTLTDQELLALRRDIVEHYTRLSQNGSAVAAAWDRGDDVAMNAAASAFDATVNTGDQLRLRADAICR